MARNIFYSFILILIVITSFTFLILGHSPLENFFSNYSSTFDLTESAKAKILILKSIFRFISIVFIAIFLFFIFRKESIVAFLKKYGAPLQNLTLLLFTLLLCLLVLELGLRFLLPDDLKYGYGAGELDYYKDHVTLNEQGYRDIDWELEKPFGVKRIAIIGDSYTFGHGLKDVDHTFARKLNEKLNEELNREYEVMNFGVDGADTAYALNVLEEDVLQYDPDIVILAYVPNDFVSAQQESEDSSGNVGYYVHWTKKIMLSSLYSYSYIIKKSNAIAGALGLKEGYETSVKKLFTSEENIEYNEQFIVQFAEQSEENEFEAVVVLFPFVYQFDNYPFTKEHNIITDYAENAELLHLDLVEHYEDMDAENLRVSRDNWHLNEEGNEIAAQAIFDFLKEERVVR